MLQILFGALAGLAVHLGLSLVEGLVFLLPFGINSRIYQAGAFGWVLPCAPGALVAGAVLARSATAGTVGWRRVLAAALLAYANALVVAPVLLLLLMLRDLEAGAFSVGTYFVVGVVTGYVLVLPLLWAVAVPHLLHWSRNDPSPWRPIAVVAAACLIVASPLLIWPVRREGMFARLEVNKALMGGKPDAALAAIRAGEPVDVMDRQGSYAIIWASERGNVEVVRELIARRAPLAVTNDSGQGPVQLAAQRGNVEVLGLLLDAGADVNEGAGRGAPALAFAATAEQPEAVRYLLKRGARTDVEGATAQELLQKAWRLRQDGVVAALQESGAARLSQADVLGRRMLEALRAGRFQEARDLLEAGADPNAPQVGDTALVTVIRSRQRELAELLLAKGAVPTNDLDTPLVWAIREEPALVPSLLARGASIEGRHGRDALLEAAGLGDLESVKALVAARVELRPDKYHPSAMRKAAESGYADVVAFLRAAGAPAEEVRVQEWREKDRRLRDAAEKGDLEQARYWLRHGADVNCARFPPLNAAAEGGHRDMVALLLEAGADPALKDPVERTALDVSEGEPEIRAMLEKAALRAAVRR